MTNLIFRVLANMVWIAVAVGMAQAQPGKSNQLKPNKFGTRDPVKCGSTTAPAKGPITVELARKYVPCLLETIEPGVNGQILYLIEDVQVLHLGPGRPYNPDTDFRVLDIGVNQSLYEIRGSLVRYQCHAENPQHPWSVPGKNCNRRAYPEAAGACFRTSLGDWHCYLDDMSRKPENYAERVAPPKTKPK